MLSAEAVSRRGVRRKLRVACGRSSSAERRRSARSAAHAGTTAPGALGKAGEAALALATACDVAADGFELCARRTRDETIAVAVQSAAAFLRALVDATVAAAAARGIDARPRRRTCERLRWEWLASTATVVDGTPCARLLSECARTLAAVDALGTAALGDGIVARFQVAAVEAYSLASLVPRLVAAPT